jgi:hypothetical protein
MVAEQTEEVQHIPLEVENPPAAPSTYPVARQAPGVDNINTIDIFGERPFSV